MADLRGEVVELVRGRGYERREEPFRLASGQLSHDYVDAKYAMDDGARLTLVSRATVEVAAGLGIAFTAVGGLTMGADALAHGVSMVSGAAWFSVRKEPKARGREQGVEGTRLDAASRVLLVDDVVTTGGSIDKAYERVLATGAAVVGVVAMVDRGDAGRALFEARGVPYGAVVTYRDLGIDPVAVPG